MKVVAAVKSATGRGGTAVEELINLQRDSDKAKVYQVRQVRAVLVRYGLTTIEGDEE